MQTRIGGFVIAGASLAGRAHAALRKNKQDAVVYRTAAWGVCGVVADGCGSGEASELGALVSARAMDVAIASAMARSERPRDALMAGASSAVRALASVAEVCAEMEARRAFVAEHLLATLVAFAVNETEGAILAAGDGIACADGAWFAFDQDNAPVYLGYSLLDRSVEAPRIIEVARPELIAVATDGFDRASLEDANALAIHQAPRGGEVLSRSLLRRMRVKQQAGGFEDDAAVAVARWVDGGVS